MTSKTPPLIAGEYVTFSKKFVAKVHGAVKRPALRGLIIQVGDGRAEYRAGAVNAFGESLEGRVMPEELALVKWDGQKTPKLARKANLSRVGRPRKR